MNENEEKKKEQETSPRDEGGDARPGPAGDSPSPPQAEAKEGGESREEKAARKRSRISWKRSAIQCEEELARTRTELEETKERLLRRIAEFENFRRRVEEEKRALREEAKAWAFGEVLHIFDMLDMALQAAEKGGSVEDLVQGLRMIQDQWKNLLGSAGVEEVPGKGNPFDPLFHDAVQVHQTEEVPPGTVTDVLRKGYRMKNRVLRHAQVVVSGKPRSSEKEEKGKNQEKGETSGREEARRESPQERAEPEGPGPQED